MMMATELDLDGVAAQSIKAMRDLKELRATLTAVSDALDFLHGMTPQQAIDTRKDAERYRHARTHGWPMSGPQCIAWTHDGKMVFGDTQEAALDAAMREF